MPDTDPYITELHLYAHDPTMWKNQNEIYAVRLGKLDWYFPVDAADLVGYLATIDDAVVYVWRDGDWHRLERPAEGKV